MLPTPEQAAPQPSTRSLIDQGEPLGLRLPRIALPLAQAFPSASLSTRPLIGSGPHCFHGGIGTHGQQGHRMLGMRETAWGDESGAAALAEPGRVIRMARALVQGVMEGGLVSPVDEGTPQGGPLTP